MLVVFTKYGVILSYYRLEGCSAVIWFSTLPFAPDSVTTTWLRVALFEHLGSYVTLAIVINLGEKILSRLTEFNKLCE